MEEPPPDDDPPPEEEPPPDDDPPPEEEPPLEAMVTVAEQPLPDISITSLPDNAAPVTPDKVIVVFSPALNDEVAVKVSVTNEPLLVPDALSATILEPTVAVKDPAPEYEERVIFDES